MGHGQHRLAEAGAFCDTEGLVKAERHRTDPAQRVRAIFLRSCRELAAAVAQARRKTA